MTSKKQDFYGKEVADAIKSACDKLQVPQEQLDIEVIETGTTGIFGLIRKKAHIRAVIKRKKEPSSPPPIPPLSSKDSGEDELQTQKEAGKPQEAELMKTAAESGGVETTSPVSEAAEHVAGKNDGEETGDESDDDDDEHEDADDNGVELPETVLKVVEEELSIILNLMGYPSSLKVTAKGNSVLCHVDQQHEQILTGQDGKTLDSLQYLLRKIIARKVPGRLRLTVDVGNYRERRLADLKVQAAELAEKVKEDGKTQVIAALSPSERRVIHMSLQDDKEIRSRSVGDGLFKKILIYKPGKGNKSSGRKRSSSRGRRGQNTRKNNG